VGDGVAFAVEGAAKAAVYAGTLLAVGVGGVHWLRALEGARAADIDAWIDRALQRRAVLSALLLLGALLLQAGVHTRVAFGVLTWLDLRTMTIESRWGHAWRFQVGAASVLAAVALALRRRWLWPWLLYSSAVLVACMTLPLLGHAAGSVSRSAIHILHILAGGIWLGTLAMLLSLAPRLYRLDRSLFARWISRFATFALPAALLLGTSGFIVASLYVGTPAHIWGSSYGRVLMLKLALVAAVACCGWHNWQQSRRGGPPRIGVLATEVCLSLLVVFVTGFLTELEHP
jgi:putative copper export protein